MPLELQYRACKYYLRRDGSLFFTAYMSIQRKNSVRPTSLRSAMSRRTGAPLSSVTSAGRSGLPCVVLSVSPCILRVLTPLCTADLLVGRHPRAGPHALQHPRLVPQTVRGAHLLHQVHLPSKHNFSRLVYLWLCDSCTVCGEYAKDIFLPHMKVRRGAVLR